MCELATRRLWHVGDSERWYEEITVAESAGARRDTFCKARFLEIEGFRGR